MKIAISSTGKDLNGKVSDVFARCPYFVIADINNGKVGKTEVLENIAVGQLRQAGVSAAQFVVEKEVKVVISKAIGPRALDVLKQFNTTIYYADGAVKDVLDDFAKGNLKELK